uniref:Uncharacterized protein n=1 Tax=Lepeophtheirus salmonis TaxID=72036 RepID=A0A0K2U593_LEPSM
MIRTWIGYDEESGLTESSLDLIGESSRSKSSSDGSGADVAGKLKNGSLSVRSRADHKDVSGILDCGNRTSRQHELLPGLTQIDDVDTIRSSLEDILLHRHFGILRSDVRCCSQHLGDVLLLKF